MAVKVRKEALPNRVRLALKRMVMAMNILFVTEQIRHLKVDSLSAKATSIALFNPMFIKKG